MGAHAYGATTGKPAPTPSWQGSSVLVQVAVLTRRAVVNYLTDPRALGLSLFQPIMLLFLISSVFSKAGSSIPGYPPGIPYFDYLLPAVLVDNALQTSLLTGAGLIDDLKNGIVARLRSLPIVPSSMLIAPSLTGVVRTIFQAIILLALAQATHGDISRGGLAGMVAAVALTTLLGWSLGWVFLAASAWIRKTDTLTNLGMVVLLPLVFVSSAFFPISDMPSGLQWFARANPVTYAVNAERDLFLHGVGGAGEAVAILVPIGFSLAIGIVAAWGAVRLFRRPLQLAFQ